MKYPNTFCQVSDEEFRFPLGSTIYVPKVVTTFKCWQGTSPIDTYGNKAIIDINGEPVFAELAILRLLQQEGWEGVWVDTYRNKKRIAIDKYVDIPSSKEALLQRVYEIAGAKSGCFDVFCWRGETVLFAEAKRKGRDRIRDTQVKWLNAALNTGLPIESFLVVEWLLEE